MFKGQDIANIYMTSFLQYLIDTNWEISAATIKNGWAEIDFVSDLKVAMEFWKRNITNG